MNKLVLYVIAAAALVGVGIATNPDLREKVVAQSTSQIAASGKTDSTFENVMSKGVVRIGVQSPSKPFFFSENGVQKGFNTEFSKLLFAQSEFGNGVRIDTSYEVDTYQEVPESLLKKDNRGKFSVDIAMDGLTFSDEDMHGVTYSIPYIQDFGYAAIVSPKSKIHVSDDLRLATIGVLQGDPDVKAFVKNKFPAARVIELSDAAVNGERVWINNFIKSGKVDVVVYDYPFAIAEIDGTDLQIAIPKIQGSSIAYKIGTRTEDVKLRDSINSAINKVKEMPEYSELIRKYFSSNKISSVKTITANETTYIVAKGDTLSIIAGKILGNPSRYTEIETRNNLPNPNFIQVGQKLIITK